MSPQKRYCNFTSTTILAQNTDGWQSNWASSYQNILSGTPTKMRVSGTAPSIKRSFNTIQANDQHTLTYTQTGSNSINLLVEQSPNGSTWNAIYNAATSNGNNTHSFTPTQNYLRVSYDANAAFEIADVVLSGMHVDTVVNVIAGGNASYRYSFQGQESDNEIKGKGNSINYKYRMHDPRLGRFFAVDPLASAFPHNSPYAFSENIVINAVELEGLEKVYVYNVYKKYGMTVRKLSHTYIDENLTDHRRVYRYFNENGEKEKTVNQDINDSERNPNKDFYGNMISSSYEDGDYWQSFVWATKKKDNDLKGKNGVKEGMKLIGATVGTILSGGTLAMATGAWATTTGVVSLVLSIDGLTEVNDNTILDHLMREKFGENGPKLLDGAKLALSVKDAAKGITNFTLKLSSGEMIDGTIDVINQTYNIGNVILDVKEKKEKQ